MAIDSKFQDLSSLSAIPGPNMLACPHVSAAPGASSMMHVWHAGQHSLKSDVWAFGVVLLGEACCTSVPAVYEALSHLAGCVYS